ncbi:MAG: hypothetical protein AB7E70_20990 [Hyphomicrobiaceae bacterium]
MTAKVVGGKRLRAFVKAMPEAVRSELYTEIKAGLEEVAAQARENLQARRNWFGGTAEELALLRTAVKVRLSRKTLRGRVSVKAPVEVRKGSGIWKNLAWMYELGTNPAKHGRKPVGPHPIPAQPFLFPAWRTKRSNVRGRILIGFNNAVRKTNARLGPMK